MTDKINLVVIFGGKSGEHEVSLSSAISVMANLNLDKYHVIPAAITKSGKWLIGPKGKEYIKLNAQFAGKENAITAATSLDSTTDPISQENFIAFTQGQYQGEKIDLVFPILHGPYGEDGRIQGMLEMIGLPYIFSNVLAHALGMNKPKAKMIVASAGVPVARGLTISSGQNYDIEAIIKELGWPLVVKPTELGSSVGVSIAKTELDLTAGITKAFKYSSAVLLEKYIKGREFTVAVLGNRDPEALPVIEIIPLISEFYDYKAKYEEGGSKHVCPALIPDSVKERLQEYALTAFEALGCKDLARADFIWDETQNELYFIEINTIPGMTATSLAPEAAKQSGLSFSQFLDKLIEGNIKN